MMYVGLNQQKVGDLNDSKSQVLPPSKKDVATKDPLERLSSAKTMIHPDNEPTNARTILKYKELPKIPDQYKQKSLSETPVKLVKHASEQLPEAVSRNSRVGSVAKKQFPLPPSAQQMQSNHDTTTNLKIEFKLPPKMLPMLKHKTTAGSSIQTISADDRTTSKFKSALNPVENPEKTPEKAIEKLNESAELEPTLIGSTELQGAEKTAEKSKKIDDKHISHTWDNGKGEMADETIDRIDTVDMAKLSAEKEINYLKGKLEDPKEQHANILSRIELITKTINKKIDIKWANSDYFRNLLKGNSKLDSSKNPRGIMGAVEEYARIMEDYHAVPVGVNLRSHSCEVKTNNAGKASLKKSWVRSGVSSDMSNGFVNLKTLKELETSITEAKSALNGKNNNEIDAKLTSATELRQKMVDEIIEKWRTSKAGGNRKVDASAGYALMQLGISLETVNAWGNTIKETDFKHKVEINSANLEKVSEAISETVTKRDAYISQLFLQKVMGHMKTLTPEDIANGEFKMLHLLLINQRSKGIDGSGWNHDEENEMWDTVEIFNKFDQKKLICDEKGPFIDLEGNIHLPKMTQLENVKELNIKAICVSQSVQGYTENNGSSKVINNMATEKLIPEKPSDAEIAMKEILERKKTSFSNAADLASLGMTAGFKVSIECASGKDRTGFVAALITSRVMLNGGFSDNHLKKIITDQLKKGSPAVRVVTDNSGAIVMKIAPFFIEGVTQGKFKAKSFAVRCISYVQQGQLIMNERQRAKKAEKKTEV